MVCGHIRGTLPLPQNICESDQGNTGDRHGIFQTQIHHTTKGMQEDAIVNAYQELLAAIKGIHNTKCTAHLEALQQTKQALEPTAISQTPALPTMTTKIVHGMHPRVPISATPQTVNNFDTDPRVDEWETKPPIPTVPVPACKPSPATEQTNSIASQVKV